MALPPVNSPPTHKLDAAFYDMPLPSKPLPPISHAYTPSPPRVHYSPANGEQCVVEHGQLARPYSPRSSSQTNLVYPENGASSGGGPSWLRNVLKAHKRCLLFMGVLLFVLLIIFLVIVIIVTRPGHGPHTGSYGSSL